MSSLSGSEVESENDDDAGTSETGTSSNEQIKNESSSKTGLGRSRKMSERRGKVIESDISDTEYNEEMSKERKLQVVASRHTKVFFENDDGNIFSIYRCLLHHKKVCLLSLAELSSIKEVQTYALFISLFLSAELVAPFIFPPFLSNVKRKKEKINAARSLAKKNKSTVTYALGRYMLIHEVSF